MLSLSIDETNKLRAKLGLKPLNVNKADAEETAEEKKQPGVLIPGDRFLLQHLLAFSHSFSSGIALDI